MAANKLMCLALALSLSWRPTSAIEIVGQVLDWASDRADKALLTRCYGDYGCFSIGGKFVSVNRPINVFPVSPTEIATRFLLFTRENPTEPQVIEATRESITNSYFRPTTPAKFIIHGFIEEGTMSWIKRTVIQLLKRGDFNVISVDWGKGAAPPYTQAVANCRLVGAVVASFIQFLTENVGLPADSMHLIGHSLGAHVCGYAGERIPRLGRITGLDPAQPYFENTHPLVRLDPTDAMFVDVIHTDVASIFQGGFGMGSACGHIDFYPNGGLKQPGCNDNIIQSIGRENGDLFGGMRNYIGCNHVRAHEYFTESIHPPCPFLGVQCTSYEEFERGGCFECGPNSERCAPLGYHSVLWYNGSTAFARTPMRMYLQTGPAPPFCRYHHRVTVSLADNLALSEQFGRLQVTLTGTYGFTRRTMLNKEDMTFQPATTYSFVIGSRDGGHIERLSIKWNPSSSMLNQLTWRVLGAGKPQIHLANIQVECLETHFRSFFCIDDLLGSGDVRAANANIPCEERSGARRTHLPARKKSSSSSSSSSSTSSSKQKSTSDSQKSSKSSSSSSEDSSPSVLADFMQKMLDLLPQ